MSLTPILASQLERIRSQVLAGRLEWQDSRAAVAHIPVENYASQVVRDAEVERLFRPLPLIAGHASELKPGQVMANDDYERADAPDARRRRHLPRLPQCLPAPRHAPGRGRPAWRSRAAASSARTTAGPTSSTARCAIACTPKRSSTRSSAEQGLVPLPGEERHGLLWVVPTPGATIDVAEHLGGLDAEMPFFGIDRLLHFRTVVADYPANWKLIVDAFLEAYHIRVLHKDTIYPFFADGMTANERFGPHIESLVARRAGETWAKEHAAAGSALPQDMPALCELVTPSHVIFPNTITIFHPDYLSLITLYPVAAGTLALDAPHADSRRSRHVRLGAALGEDLPPDRGRRLPEGRHRLRHRHPEGAGERRQPLSHRRPCRAGARLVPRGRRQATAQALRRLR